MKKDKPVILPENLRGSLTIALLGLVIVGLSAGVGSIEAQPAYELTASNRALAKFTYTKIGDASKTLETPGLTHEINKHFGHARWGNLQPGSLGGGFESGGGDESFHFTPLTFPGLVSNYIDVADDRIPWNGLTATFENASKELFGARVKDGLALENWPFTAADVDFSNSKITLHSLPSGSETGLFRAHTFRPENLRIHLGNSSLSKYPESSKIKHIVVLLHGWNPDSEADMYDNPVAFNLLYENLKTKVLTATPARNDIGILKYHWSRDSDTGGKDLALTLAALHAADSSAFGPFHAARAAETAHIHGWYLGQLIDDAIGAQVETVQLIAHSAGSWAARSCAYYLANNAIKIAKAGKKISLQVTLLDAYVPSQASAIFPVPTLVAPYVRPEYFPAPSSSLSPSLMAALKNSLDGAPNLKDYILDNYFENDLTVVGTQEKFDGWAPNGGRSTSLVGGIDALLGDGHAAPITWYAKTAAKDMDNVDPTTGVAWRLGDTARGYQDSLLNRVLSAKPDPVLYGLSLSASPVEVTVSLEQQDVSTFAFLSGTTKSFKQGTRLSLIAPSANDRGHPFKEWQLSGVSLSANRTISIVMDSAKSLAAVYTSPASGEAFYVNGSGAQVVDPVRIATSRGVSGEFVILLETIGAHSVKLNGISISGTNSAWFTYPASTELSAAPALKSVVVKYAIPGDASYATYNFTARFGLVDVPIVLQVSEVSGGGDSATLGAGSGTIDGAASSEVKYGSWTTPYVLGLSGGTNKWEHNVPLTEPEFHRLASWEFKVNARNTGAFSASGSSATDYDLLVKFRGTTRQTIYRSKSGSTEVARTDFKDFAGFSSDGNLIEVRMKHSSATWTGGAWSLESNWYSSIGFSKQAFGATRNFNDTDYNAIRDGFDKVLVQANVTSISAAGKLELYNNGKFVESKSATTTGAISWSVPRSSFSKSNVFSIRGNSADATKVTLADIKLTTTYFSGSPLLTIAKSLSSSNVTIGDIVTVTIEYRNTGSNNAIEINMADAPVPTGFEFVDGSISDTDNSGIGPGKTQSIAYRMRATRPGTYSLSSATGTFKHPTTKEVYSATSNVASLVVSGGKLVVSGAPAAADYGDSKILTADVSVVSGSAETNCESASVLMRVYRVPASGGKQLVASKSLVYDSASKRYKAAEAVIISDPASYEATIEASGVDYTPSDSVTTPFVILPFVEILGPDQPIVESAGPIRFLINRVGEAAGDLSVGISLVGSTATSSDYYVPPSTIAISRSASGALLEIALKNDTIVEESKTIKVQVMAGSGYRIRSNIAAVVTIQDDDVAADTTPPTVTVNQASGQLDPTDDSLVNFTVVFSELVTGFSEAGVSLSGTAGATTKTVTGSGSTYNIAVSGMTQSGTVVASVPQGRAQDSAGNYNTASTSTDATVTYNKPDTTAPTVTVNQATGQSDPATSAPINFTVVFSVSVTGFTDGDVILGGTAGASTKVVTGSGAIYNVAVSGMTQTGSVTLRVPAGGAQNAAGIGNAASTSTDSTVTYNMPDTTAPTVSINQASGQPDPTTVAVVNFTVVFSEAVSGFDQSDVTLSGTAGATTKVVTGSGAVYNVSISGMTQSGAVTVNVPAGVAQDAAGNPNTASTSTDATVTYNVLDATAPEVTLSQASGQSDPTSATPINYTVVFSEAVTGFSEADIVLGGTAGATAKEVTGSGTTYNVTVSGMTRSGTVIVSVPAGGAQDAAGNLNTASTSSDAVVTYSMPAGELLSDAFSGDLSNWTVMANDGGATWQIEGGNLIGYYDISRGSPSNTQSFLLLNDNKQPVGDWTASVDFTLTADPYQPTLKSSSVALGLWVSATSKLNITVGHSEWNWTVSPRSTIDVGVARWNGSVWQGTGLDQVVNLAWDPSGWNRATLTKAGNVYQLFVNGIRVLEFADTYLNGLGKLGLHTYGPKKLDNFEVRSSSVPTKVLGLSGTLAFGNVTANQTATSALTISNTGNTPLNVSGISYPAGFSGSWSSGSIPAGATQSVTVTFSPTLSQAYGGTVTVASDKTGGTNTVVASGTGVPQSVSLVSDAFSSDLSNWTVVANDGGATWQIVGGNLIGYYDISRGSPSNTQSFLLLNDNKQPVGDWTASVDFTLTADPYQPTFKSSSVALGLWASATSKLNITVGHSEWNWTLSPRSTIDVGVARWNGASWQGTGLDQVVNLSWDPSGWNRATLTKAGNVYRLFVNGTKVLEFEDTYLNGVAKLGLHTYGPKKLDNFEVRNFTSPTKVIGLSGSMAFGNVTANQAATKALTISNTGDSALNVSSITYPTGFSGSWSSGSVAPGGTQSVLVTFSPTLTQDYGGILTVNSDKTSGVNTITASGSGAAVPTKVLVLSGNLTVGSVTVNQTATSTLVIQNMGNSTLIVSSIAYPNGFSGNWSSGSIAPGGTQNVTVTFAPTLALSYGGVVTVTSDKTGGTNTIAASGVGTVAPTRVIELSGNLSFGNVTVDTADLAILTISNIGSMALNISGINYPAGFSGDWPAGTIGAGGSQNVTVAFTPTLAQAYGGTITVSSDKTSGTNAIAANGTGTLGEALATVTTGLVSQITSTGARLEGMVVTDGGSSVTERGYVFATTPAPTIMIGIKYSDGGGVGAFATTLTALTPNTTYYWRAYATNSVGTSYGAESVFTTDPTLVAYYRFDGSVIDLSGKGNNAASNGGMTFEAGQIDQAARFNGTNGYLNVGTRTLDTIEAGDYTQAIWVKGGPFTTRTSILQKQAAAPAGGNPGWVLSTHENNSVFYSRYTLENGVLTVGTPLMGTTPVGDGAWHHIATVRQGNLLSLYIDGRLEASAATGSGTATNAADLGIGRRNALADSYFAGALDEFRYYSRALTVAEIGSLAGRSAALIGHWKFDGNVQDAGPNGLHGTNFGGAFVADRNGTANAAIRLRGHTTGNLGVPAFATGDYVLVPRKGGQPALGSRFSVSFWMRPLTAIAPVGASSGVAMMTMISQHSAPSNTSGTWQFSLVRDNPGALFQASPYFDATVSSVAPVPIGVWTHVCLTYGDGQWKMYTNGVKNAEGSRTFSEVLSVYDLVFGSTRHPSGPNGQFYFYDGDLDDVRLHSAVLGENEVANLAGLNGAPAAPVILAQPQGSKVALGANVSLAVTAASGQALTYQWQKNGTAISGATLSVLELSGMRLSDFGTYNVVVSSAGGSVTSNAALLSASVGTVVTWGTGDAARTTVPAGLVGVVAVAAGLDHTAVLKADGTVVVFGKNTDGQLNVPAGLVGVTAIAAGAYHTVALKSDGTVVAWGMNNHGQNTVPAGLSGVVAVAAGSFHSLALRSDRTVAAWGFNDDGETNVPAGLNGVRAIAGGGYHSFALRNDGTITGWGRNTEGQLTPPAGLIGVTAIAASGVHTVALKSDGTVAAWGRNDQGQVSVPVGLNGVVGISSPYYHSLALKNDGSVVAWGRNAEGEVTIPSNLNGVIAVSAGFFHSVALVGVNSEAPIITTQPVNQTLVAGGTATFTVASSGTPSPTYQWQRLVVGTTTWADLADGALSIPSASVMVSGASSASLTISGVVVAMSGDQFRCIASNGVFPNGTSNVAALTVTIAGVVAPSITAQPQGSTIASGQTATLSVTAAGTAPLAYQWRRNGVNIDGATNATYAISSVQTAHAGSYDVVVRNAAGSVTSASAALDVVPLYTFITLAGSAGIEGSTDGAGSLARFGRAQFSAVDAAGNFYVADTTNHVVRKVTPTGVVSTFAGLAGSAATVDGTGSAARFNNPIATAVDASGNVFVSEYDGHVVRKITPAGVVATIAGSAGAAGTSDGTGNAARFNHPEGMAIDASGNIYLADAGNNTIRRITSAGVVTTIAGLAGVQGGADGGGTVARFSVPGGLALEPSGNVVVSDQGGHTIRRVTQAGVVTTIAGQAGVAGSSDGTGSAARFNQPGGLAVDSVGNIFVADVQTHLIRRINAAGVVTTIGGMASTAGSADGVGTAARFYYPVGIAVDGNGNLFITDMYNRTIRKGTPSATTVAPVFVTQPASLNLSVGGTASFTVTATGTPSPTYQWQRQAVGTTTWADLPNGALTISSASVTVSGASSATLTISGVVAAMTGDQFRCIASNGVLPNATSSAAALTVTIAVVAPSITAQPQGSTIATGQTATLSVTAIGTAPLTYQWYQGTSPSTTILISGATAATYTTPALSATTSYWVRVSNGVNPPGYSNTATVVVEATSIAPTARTSPPVGETYPITVTSNTAWTASSNQAWATVTPASGSNNGTVNVVVGANAGTTSRSATITIGGQVHTLTQTANITTITPIEHTSPAAGDTYTIAVTSNTSWTAVSSQSWATVSPASGSNNGAVTVNVASTTSGRSATITIGGQTHTLTQSPPAASFPVVALTSETGAWYSTAGGNTNLRVRVTYTGQTPSSIGVTVALPVGWTFVSDSGPAASARPVAGDNLLEWALSSLPANEQTFTINVAYPAGQTGDKSVTGSVIYRPGPITVNFTPLAYVVKVVPVISLQPVSKVVAVDTGITITAGATGAGPFTYQWKKDGTALVDGSRISGATTATLSIASLALTDSGSYSVLVSNDAGGTPSNNAVLTVVDARATHVVASGGYTAGGQVTLTQTLTYTGACTGIGWQMVLPAGWTYASGTGSEGDVKPTAGTGSLLEWAWTSVPVSPVTFTITLNVPAGTTGDKTLTSLAIFRVSAGAANILAKPDPLTVSEGAFHRGDTNHDGRISLLELTRMIELYNTRNGTVRTGCYSVQAGTEDGFAPDTTRGNTVTISPSIPHSADSNRDGKISLLELTRVIELYNYRSGASRTGQYRQQSGTEDGFAPGP